MNLFVMNRAARRYNPPASGGGGTDLYPGTTLDLNTIEFHTTSGAWGAQQTVLPPTPPTITREVTVTNPTDMETELKVPGTRVIANFNTTVDCNVLGFITDAELVIPTGSQLGPMTMGGAINNRSINRLRIRGDTFGTNGGGIVGKISILGADVNDVHCDGINFNGQGNGGFQVERLEVAGVQQYAERIALTNCRLTALEATFLSAANHLVVWGCSFSSGRGPTGSSSSIEAWCIRNNGGPAIYANNYFHGRSFHRIRNHPRVVAGATPQYVWMKNNTMVDICQARLVWLSRVGSHTADDVIDAAWFENNECWAENADGQTAPSLDLSAMSASGYVRVSNNIFHGDFTQSVLNGQDSLCPASNEDWTTGNTYGAITTLPTPDRAGDPEAIPLSGGSGAIIQAYPFRSDIPVGTLSITATWPADATADGFIVYVSRRSRATNDATLYPWTYLAGPGTTSLVINELVSGTVYVRVAPYIGSTIGTVGAQNSYTPA